MDRKKRLGRCKTGICSLIGLTLFGMAPLVRADVDPKYYAVMASAEVQNAPARITLRWGSDPQANSYSISRRNGNSWDQVGSVGGNENSWSDNNVADGGSYEYRILKNTSGGYSGVGFVLAGLNAPLKDYRGKVVLLVDNTYASALDAELRRLEWDLAGDGWTVLRHDVSRNDSVANIKGIIKADYNSDPSSVKAAFLFGHIPVPYSGNLNPDGHPDHQGAWPADMYYGDMDGNWTDSSTSGGSGRNSNSPGDGKFDQSNMPSPVEVAVGRVDFNNMTCFANKTPSRSELDLLRAYLNKDHNFRHRVFTVARRGLVCDNFGDKWGEAFAASGWRNFGSFFGADNVTSVGYGQYFSTLRDQDYLWSYGTGGGAFYTCNGIGGSDDFATTDIKTVFTMFLGSYFGDWDNESNFLRAPLGSGYCLTTSWAGRPHWFYHHMGLGEPIGVSTIASQNNEYGSLYPTPNQYTSMIHVALLGDPTLRMHPVIPPSNVQGNASGSTMNLSWNGSGDSAIQGYHVYRGNGPRGQFTRLTQNPIGGTSFSDPGYSPGSTYMVRAIKLEQSGSGTYLNGSQGAFFPENAPVGENSGGSSNGGGGGGTPVAQTPTAPASLSATANGPSQIDVAWQDKSSDETGFRIDRRTGVSGDWAQVANVNANATQFSVTGLSSGTTYYFRVCAVNNAGTSMPSNEAGASTSTATPTDAGAQFLGVDSSTSGAWRSSFGKDGYNVITGGSSYPGYATVEPAGKQDYQWSDYTAETRALDKVNGGGRIIGCWFAPESFTLNVNFVDGQSHKIALYFVDWDRKGRSQQVQIIDAFTGSVLDSQTIQNFENGVYLRWNLKGQVQIRISRLAGANVLVNGIFFDPGQAVGSGGHTSQPGGLVGGSFQLQVNGQPGQKFDIYASENLLSWEKISETVLTGSTFNFTDSTSQGKTRRFYRAVAVP